MARRWPYKKIFVSVIALFCVKSIELPAMSAVLGRNDYLPDKGTLRLLGKVQASTTIAAEIARLTNERTAAGSAVNPPEHVRQNIQSLDDQIRELRLRQSSLFRPSNSGTLVARGLAGHDWEFLDDSKIDNIGEGIAQGMTVRTSKALGDVLSDRITGAFEYTLGGAFDHLFSRLVDLWSDFCCIAFHDSQTPFTVENLKAWQDSIKESFEDLEKMMKDGLKDSLRGHDMTLRQFDLPDQKTVGSADDGDSKMADSKMVDNDATIMSDLENSVGALSLEDTLPKTPWNSVVESYVEPFERCIIEIEKHKGYYAADSDELFFANQIKKRLRFFGSLLLQSQSIKELDAALDSNKALIPALKKRIDNLFKRLIESIKPRTYSLVDKGSQAGRDSLTKKERSRRDTEDEDREFPNSYWNR